MEKITENGWMVAETKKIQLRCQKIATRTHSKLSHKPQSLSVEDLEEAEKSIICYEQQQRYFKSELALLKKGKSVKMDSAISKLDLTVDEGILRIGRLNKAAMLVNLKNPIILPKVSRV